METQVWQWQRTDLHPSVVMRTKLNTYRRINRYLESVNEQLPVGGLLIGHAETTEAKKIYLLKKFLFPFNLVIYFMYFSTHRLFPKINRFSASLYFHLSGGRNRMLSRAEILGRICSCGFSIRSYRESDGLLEFVAEKTGKPAYNMRPSYWPIFKMQRVGKQGRMINVYKLRTMHPYSEYLQQFMLENNGLDKGGKFRNDFRVTSWGRILRKYWLDELPMLVNLLKGDLKLVGVRPLSLQYYNMYSEELRLLRFQTKPGLIPPFYADMPKTLEEIMESEKNYLLSYYKHPLRTDLSYLCRGLYNILIKKVRSK